MSKIVTDFLTDVKKEKVRQLLGIALDTEYWTKIVATSATEKELREGLEAENNKRVINKNGTVFKDDRDQKKIDELNTAINNITKAGTELKRLKEMEGGIKGYLKHVQNPDANTKKVLEEVAKI